MNFEIGMTILKPDLSCAESKSCFVVCLYGTSFGNVLGVEQTLLGNGWDFFFAPHIMCPLQNKDCFDPECPKKLNEPADFVAATMERLQVIIWRAARLKN